MHPFRYAALTVQNLLVIVVCLALIGLLAAVIVGAFWTGNVFAW